MDANASKDHPLKVARKLDIRGRSSMKKKELVMSAALPAERPTEPAVNLLALARTHYAPDTG